MAFKLALSAPNARLSIRSSRRTTKGCRLITRYQVGDDRLRQYDLSGVVELWYNTAFDSTAQLESFVANDCLLVDSTSGKSYMGPQNIKDAAMHFKHKFVACSLCGRGAQVDLDHQQVQAHWTCYSQASIDCDGDPTFGTDIFTLDADGRIKKIEINVCNPETMGPAA